MTKSVVAEFKEGDEVEAYIFRFDEQGKNIELSQLDADQKKVKAAKKKADMETGAPTLGEMSGLAALKEKMEAEKQAEADQKAKNEE